MSADIMPAGRSCRGCAFWQPHAPHLGECRVLPPVILRSPNGEHETWWPEVAEDDWCGQHRPRSARTALGLPDMGPPGTLAGTVP